MSDGAAAAAFSLPTLGLRNTAWGLVWLVFVCAVTVTRPLLLGGLTGPMEVLGSLAFSAVIWFLTPHLLLGRRLGWFQLAPAAVLSAIGVTGIGVWSVIWMPHTLAASARQFGIIGIGFALLTWLVSVGLVLVVATTGGAMIADRLTGRRYGWIVSPASSIATNFASRRARVSGRLASASR